MSSQANVYIVDDDDLLLETLDALFTQSGYVVHTFLSSEAFLNANIQSSNACLILDLSLPNTSGLELQKKLNINGVNIPIIIYSGKADVDSTVKAMEEGAITLLQKPVEPSVLLEKVDKAIQLHHVQQTKYSDACQAKNKLSVLSKREQKVAELVADGMSAQSVAENLFISPRTVEAHKAKIFQKLNIKSVAQLTQIVMLSRLA